MSQICATDMNPSDNDDRLIAEAMRRAMASRFNLGTGSDAIEQAIKTAVRRGTKDMHGLMREAAKMARTPHAPFQ